MKQLQQSKHLWNAINQFDFKNNPESNLQQLITLTFILEECIHLEVQNLAALNLLTDFSATNPISCIIADTLQFFYQPEVYIKSTKTSFPSFTTQLFSPERTPSPPGPDKKNSTLQDAICQEFTTMEIDNCQSVINPACNQSETHCKTVSWSTDIGITSLSEDLFTHLKDYQAKVDELGELDSDLPEY